MWVKQYEPSVWESAETFVLPKDYVRLRLTGVACTEPTDAAGTLLFDIHTGSWMYDLAEQLGLTDLTLPPIAHSHVPVGYITPLAAQETGIPVGIPVVGGASDMACTVLGGGLMAEGDTSITLSTAAQVLTAIEQPMHAKFQGTSYNLHAQAGLGFLMGSIYAGGYSYKWIRDLLKLQAVTHAELEEQVKQVKPGCDGLLYLPHILGAGTPTFDPAFRGAFLEVSAYHTPFHFVRAAMEGVAFQIRECVELVENAGVSITTCLIGAGGSRNSLWRQIIADVLNRPLRVPSCLDLSGMGAAILAGVGAEIYPDLQAGFSAMVQITGVVEPQESNRAAYNDQYERFRDYTCRLLPSK